MIEFKIWNGVDFSRFKGRERTFINNGNVIEAQKHNKNKINLMVERGVTDI